MIIIGYVLAVIMGMTLGLIGAGGSILTMPILVYFLDVSPVTATGYSLLLVGMTALIGGIGYYRKQMVDIPTAAIFALPSLIAVYATRRWLVPIIPDPAFSVGAFIVGKDLFIMLLFAALMLVAALMMIRSGSGVESGQDEDSKSIKTKKQKRKIYRILLIGVEGAIVGVFTGIIGAGGGFLIIPALVLLAGMEMKIAVGSSLLIIAAKSLIGFIGDLQAGINLDYTLLGIFLICTIVGMFIGTALSKHIPPTKLKKAFGWFTLCVAVIILFKEL